MKHIALITKAAAALSAVVTVLVVFNVITTDQAGAIATALGAVVATVTAFLAGYHTDNSAARTAKAIAAATAISQAAGTVRTVASDANWPVLPAPASPPVAGPDGAGA